MFVLCVLGRVLFSFILVGSLFHHVGFIGVLFGEWPFLVNFVRWSISFASRGFAFSGC